MKKLLSCALLLLPFSASAKPIFADDSMWETVTKGHQFAEGMVLDKDGNLFFTDVPRSQLFKIDAKTGKKTLLDGETGRANGIAAGPDGAIYGCASGDKCIYRWDPKTWKKTAIAKGPHSNDIAIRKDGTIFFTDPQTKSVWRISGKDRKLERAVQLQWNPNGITLSRDDTTLYVAEFFSPHIHAFHIKDDLSLGADTLAYKLKTPEDKRGFLDGMIILNDNRLLSGTKLGMQVAYPLTRATSAKPQTPIVTPIPNDLPRCNYVRISRDGKWLYAAHAKVILRRALHPKFLR